MILARFKFGGSVQDCHTFICMKEILADFNLVVGRPTAKVETAEFKSSPNFLAIRYCPDISPLQFWGGKHGRRSGTRLHVSRTQYYIY